MPGEGDRGVGYGQSKAIELQRLGMEMATPKSRKAPVHARAQHEAALHWWLRDIDEHKHAIEEALDWYLSQPQDLTDRQKLLLRDALDNTDRGLFGLAMQVIYDAGIAENRWSSEAAVDPSMAVGVTKQSLRERLKMVKATTARSRPIF